jgi:RND family efflux transporter MFP subunit
VLTHFSDVTELFVEFPPLVAGQKAPFLAHLTRLDDFKPVQQGGVTIALVGGGVPAELFTVDAPIAAGIFRPLVQPQYAVKRQLVLTIQADGLAAKHDLGEYQVFASAQEAQAATPAKEEPEDVIHYLKEQQWQVDFATTPAQQRQLRASIQATGTLRPRADGEAYLSATSAGHLHNRGDFPYVGMGVEIGQVLASIIPRLGLDSDLSTLRAAQDKARSQYELARHERDRLQQLWADKVVALHRLHEAESALEVAKAELDAAQRRYQQSSGERPLTDSGIPVLAPISGVLAQVHAAPGSYVAEGETLFHIVNLDRLWLEARIAEADIGRLQQPEGAWFTLEGFAQTFDTFELNGSLVALGGVIDAASRTVPLIFAFDNPDHRLRSGMFANVRVFTGESQAGLAVPRSALFDDGGEEVVYVMLGGETFQRRRVRLGIDEADWVQVLSGVAPGERVVSKGAYLLRLAASAPLEAGHGHVH